MHLSKFSRVVCNTIATSGSSARFVQTQARHIPSNLTDALKSSISDIVSGRCSTSASVLQQHGTDESYHTPVPPELVVYPQDTKEVAEIHRLCNAARVPVVPFGCGTSLEGHVAATRGGISLDMSRMDRIIDVNVADMTARVQSGVMRKALNGALRPEGVFFSVDPGADATLGGMAATRASGTNSVKYGTMRDNVLGLQVVMANGDVVHTGGGVKKSSAGYDLTHLLVGSEGTLGTLTEVTLRLWPQPEAVTAATCTFPSLAALVQCATTVMQTGAPVARMEMLDDVTVQAVNRYCGTALTEAPTLLFEFNGSKAAVTEASEACADIAAEEGAAAFQWASSPAARADLWEARHKAYWASIALKPGGRGFPTDVCVPISHLAECVLESKALVDRKGLLSPMVGHVGDGNFHMMLMVDPSDADEMGRAQEAVEEMIAIALAFGGTCTGEHGIGHGKLKYLEREHGTPALHAMHAIKAALDPHNIMNPGKLGSHPDSFRLAEAPATREDPLLALSVQKRLAGT